METFWIRDLLFIPPFCDYFNFVAFVIGGYPVDVYLGENITLKLWILPGTVRLSWVGFGAGLALWSKPACIHMYVSYTAWVIIIIPIFYQPWVFPAKHNALAAAKVMHIHGRSTMCLCSDVDQVSSLEQACLWGGHWAVNFWMTSSKGARLEMQEIQLKRRNLTGTMHSFEWDQAGFKVFKGFCIHAEWCMAVFTEIYTLVIKIASTLPRERKVESEWGAVGFWLDPDPNTLTDSTPNFSTLPKIIFHSAALYLHSFRRGICLSVWTTEDRFCKGIYPFPLNHKGYFHLQTRSPA